MLDPQKAYSPYIEIEPRIKNFCHLSNTKRSKKVPTQALANAVCKVASEILARSNIVEVT